jgi:hypothetical protein
MIEPVRCDASKLSIGMEADPTSCDANHALSFSFHLSSRGDLDRNMDDQADKPTPEIPLSGGLRAAGCLNQAHTCTNDKADAIEIR